MVSLADDQPVRRALDKAARYWQPKPEGWDEPLDVDGICGYVSDSFLPCALPAGHEGWHTHVALNPESGPEGGANDPSQDPSGRPIDPLGETPSDSVARRQQSSTGEDMPSNREKD